jgi:uncharacterized UPF0160 family protein
MSWHCATHSGPFHADDVLAMALIRSFLDPDATVERTRDPARLAAADLVFDVGAQFDPATHRFDHHQAAYEGPLSSAGMVLAWLAEAGHVAPDLREHLDRTLVTYVDDVDNGRRAPEAGVPCFASIVDAYNQPAESEADYLAAFEAAAEMARGVVHGLAAEHAAIQHARTVVAEAMAAADREGRRVLFFDRYVRWKPAYFGLGGADHASAFVLFPASDGGSWRIVAIPPEEGSFDQKVSLPEPWAGLTDEALEAVTGIPGSIFCHKNRFIAVFATREGAVQALVKMDMMHA